MLIRGSPLRAVTTSAHKIQDSPIGDFDVSEDVVVYKAANGTTPNITVAYSAGATASSGDAIIQVDGQNTVMVSGVGISFDISNVVVSTY